MKFKIFIVSYWSFQFLFALLKKKIKNVDLSHTYTKKLVLIMLIYVNLDVCIKIYSWTHKTSFSSHFLCYY
jgi:hypothetical protein